MKKLVGIVFALALCVLCLSACGSEQEVSVQADALDLDYIVNENAVEEEIAEDEPWYSLIMNAFSFGSAIRNSDKEEQDKPDTVAEIYQQGTAPEVPVNTKEELQDIVEEEKREIEENKTDDDPGNSSGKSKDSSEEDEPENEEPEDVQKTQNEPVEETNKNTVTMHIRCDTAVANGMHLESKWAGIVPASGIILDTTVFEIEEGDTVFDVLCQARDKYKLHMEYSGAGSGIYVEGINNLYEFDGGRWSGWMYCVNEWYPNYGCGVYYVQPGDVIEWNYTCDLGCDLENGDPYGYGKDWKDTHD